MSLSACQLAYWNIARIMGRWGHSIARQRVYAILVDGSVK